MAIISQRGWLGAYIQRDDFWRLVGLIKFYLIKFNKYLSSTFYTQETHYILHLEEVSLFYLRVLEGTILPFTTAVSMPSIINVPAIFSWIFDSREKSEDIYKSNFLVPRRWKGTT